MTKKRVAVLISGRGSNMIALIEAAKAKDYPAEIVLVVSNRIDALGLARARTLGVATAVVDPAQFFAPQARAGASRATAAQLAVPGDLDSSKAYEEFVKFSCNIMLGIQE